MKSTPGADSFHITSSETAYTKIADRHIHNPNRSLDLFEKCCSGLFFLIFLSVSLFLLSKMDYKDEARSQTLVDEGVLDTKDEEKKVVRALDRHMLPLFCIFYFTDYLGK